MVLYVTLERFSFGSHALPYGLLADETRAYGACNFEIGGKPRVTEPPDEVRGDAARFWLYMVRNLRNQDHRCSAKAIRAMGKQRCGRRVGASQRQTYCGTSGNTNLHVK